MIDIISKFDENGVFSDEQKEVINKAFEWYIDIIDKWMYQEVLPKTINADDEPYIGYGIIPKVRTNFE